jgi:transglutaminase-like putative cysteine protease
LIKHNQSAGDIVSALLTAVRLSTPQCKHLANKFRRETPETTALAVYDFMRKNFIYRKESSSAQTAKTLPRIIADSRDGTTGDCKHFSTTAGVILKCLGLPVYFRVIDQIGRWNHIYTVVKYPHKEIIIDGTYPYFNRETNYNKKIDIKI